MELGGSVDRTESVDGKELWVAVDLGDVADGRHYCKHMDCHNRLLHTLPAPVEDSLAHIIAVVAAVAVEVDKDSKALVAGAVQDSHNLPSVAAVAALDFAGFGSAEVL